MFRRLKWKRGSNGIMILLIAVLMIQTISSALLVNAAGTPSEDNRFPKVAAAESDII